MDFRTLGQNPYAEVTKEGKLRELALSIHMEEQRRIGRLNETLSAQSMLDGVQDGISGTTDTDFRYDFKRKSANTFTVSPLWNGSSPTIMADLDDGCDLLRQNGHIRGDICIMGSTAINAFLEDTDVRAEADNRRFNLINILTNPVPSNLQFMVDGGFDPRGTITTHKGRTLWLFTYDEFYQTDAGTSTPYMPIHKVLLTSSQARFDRYFGPSDMMPVDSQRRSWMQEVFGFGSGGIIEPMNVKNPSHTFNAGMFYMDAYRSADGKKASIRTQCAPIFATTMTDAVVTMTVTS